MPITRAINTLTRTIAASVMMGTPTTYALFDRYRRKERVLVFIGSPW